MNYGDLNAALQRLLRWGSPNMQGLEQLLKQLREARERELGRYNLDSTVDQLRQEVQDVIDTEREGIERRQNEAATPDRKSTRLNSSHVSISYAVFCLKKKITLSNRHRSSYF